MLGRCGRRAWSGPVTAPSSNSLVADELQRTNEQGREPGLVRWCSFHTRIGPSANRHLRGRHAPLTINCWGRANCTECSHGTDGCREISAALRASGRNIAAFLLAVRGFRAARETARRSHADSQQACFRRYAHPRTFKHTDTRTRMRAHTHHHHHHTHTHTHTHHHTPTLTPTSSHLHNITHPHQRTHITHRCTYVC